MIFDRGYQAVLMAVMAFAPGASTAQITDRDPLNAATTAASAPYHSAFEDYEVYKEPELMSWRGANDTVREFGSMAGMSEMGGMKGMDGKAGSSSETNQANMPVNDMKKRNEKTPAATMEKPMPSDTKASESGSMPGHDMSKMKNAGDTPKTNTKPDSDMKGMKGMADMPTHNMQDTTQPKIAIPPRKTPTSENKSYSPASQAMPEHSGVQIK